jgi:phosphoribosyl 1,2-cyclic phosphodiesterase
MKVKFYGVRGSIAVAGDDTRHVGGNTSCVVVEAGGERIILDAGTGIRKLGVDTGPVGVRAHLLFSHLHWDHIQGFPFFTPAFVPNNEIVVVGVHGEPGDGAPAHVRDALAAQMTAPNFPVGMDVMRANLSFVDLGYGDRFAVGAVDVRHVAVDHPNGCVAWRIEHAGKSIVYATDVELPDADCAAHDALVELARGADVLVFDAMYTPEEYAGSRGPSRRGWGHSTFEAGACVAERAGVRDLWLFHHDPAHDDTFMDALGTRAQKRFAHTHVAREGIEVTL